MEDETCKLVDTFKISVAMVVTHGLIEPLPTKKNLKKKCEGVLSLDGTGLLMKETVHITSEIVRKECVYCFSSESRCHNQF